MESDPLGLIAGINTYGYVHNEPTLKADRFGLWSTDAHNLILEHAFPNLTWGLQEAIETGSAIVDWGQGPSTAYQHETTAPGESIADARRKMCAFISDHLGAYNSLRQNPSPSSQYAAYFNLGEALHPIMDSTSPAHAGWQVWGNPLSPRWWFEWLNHGDSADTIEDVAHLSPALLAETVIRIHDAMNGAGVCGCR